MLNDGTTCAVCDEASAIADGCCVHCGASRRGAGEVRLEVALAFAEAVEIADRTQADYSRGRADTLRWLVGLLGPAPSPAPARDYHDENGDPLRCQHDGRPAYYDETDDAYHHAWNAAEGCFLIPCEDHADDLDHPLALTDPDSPLVQAPDPAYVVEVAVAHTDDAYTCGVLGCAQAAVTVGGPHRCAAHAQVLDYVREDVDQ